MIYNLLPQFSQALIYPQKNSDRVLNSVGAEQYDVELHLIKYYLNTNN